MITLEVFLEEIKPFNFFDSPQRAIDYYFAIENSLFKLAGCMLQEGFKNINLQALNYNINIDTMTTINRLNFDINNNGLLFLKEQDFLVDLNNFPSLNVPGVFHIADLLTKSGNAFNVNRLNYFLTNLAAYSLQYKMPFYSELNNFLNKNLILTDNLSLEFKKFIIADFLSKNDNGRRSIEYNIFKNKSFAILKYYYILFDEVRQGNLVTGILFENIVSKESYEYFMNKMLSYNFCNALIDKLDIAD